MDAGLVHVLFGALLSALGMLILIIYRQLLSRIGKLEKKQSACLALLTRLALKNGIDEQIIKDIQEAIQQ